MSFSLCGPYPFDVHAPTAGAREALAAVGAALREGRDGELLADARSGEAPGLYVLLFHDGGQHPAIGGFWITFGAEFLEDGATDTADRQPPYAQALLDAATEEVWWRTLRVARKKRKTWHPLIVLEWPPTLASRASLYPPGVLPNSGAETFETVTETGDWLPDFLVGAPRPRTKELLVDVTEELIPSLWEGLPARRSLLTVVRGTLTHDATTHQGRFELLRPIPAASESEALLLEDWIERCEVVDWAKAPPQERHYLGHPLALPGPRVGFPLSCWLTRALEPWPAKPGQQQPGQLTARVVRSRWKAQLSMAVGSTVAVLALVLGLSLVVQLAAQPRPRPMATTPPPATQPAMSVCSADHQKFVKEFRCQIARLYDPEGVDGPVCGDPGSEATVEETRDDLQAAFCGLMDRERDGWLGNLHDADSQSMYNFADLAASQACFNVLGHPHPYRQDDVGAGGTPLADPDRFLRDPALHIQSLTDLVADLRDACDLYRTELEHRVEGAVFATHVGAPTAAGSTRESSRLREALMSQATVGMADDAERCFVKGTTEGLGESEDFEHLCGEPQMAQRRMAKKKIWVALAGAESGDMALVDRYILARFGTPATGQTSSLWRCHLLLAGLIPATSEKYANVRWDLRLDIPTAYDIDGGRAVHRQLLLDAALLDFDEGVDAGICWDVVAKRLDGYSPVHPLLADLDDSTWVSEQQQLCGQVCATYYRARTSDRMTQWVTRGADLAACLNPDPPGSTPDLGRGRLDQLRLPWNGTRATGWVKPSSEEICAFNLIAQEYMPAGESGFLVGDKDPAQWAGETAPGSGIAGGPDSLAVRGAKNLSSFGRNRSSSTCGHVAAQCFTGELVEVMGDAHAERYEWRDTWMRKVRQLAGATPQELDEFSPWCRLINPYLHLEGNLPEGEIDYPCASGVDQALRNVEQAARQLSAETPRAER